MAAIRDLILNLQERKEGNALTSAANDLDKLSRGVDSTGGAMRGMEKDAKRLNTEIERTNARIKDLHKQFAATGDTSLFGDIRKEETRLRNLTKTFKALTPDFVKAGEDLGATLGVSVTNSFGQQLSSAFSGAEGTPGLGPGLIAGIGALLAVSAAPLGAAIAGAVVGAVGTGGIVGGVLAASHDPQVKSAFQALGDDAKSVFFDAGSSFVEPVLKSVGTLEQALHKIDLDKTFALAAPDLEVIVGGLAGLVENTMPGLNTLLSRSGPFANAAAEGFKGLGVAVSEFLDNVSASPGAVEGLQLLFAAIEGTIKGLGVGLKFLADEYSGFVNVAAGASGVLAKTLDFAGLHFGFLSKGAEHLEQMSNNASGAVKGLGYQFDRTAIATAKSAEALQRENDELKNTIDLIDNAINLMLSLDNAQLALNKDFKGLSDAIAQNGRHWNDNTDAAFNNQQAILGALGDLERVRDQEIKTGKAVADANAEYEAGLTQILKYAGALGATKAQLEAIRGRYDIVLAITTIEDVVGNIGRKLAGIIPHFDSGGTVPGPAGMAQLAVVHGQERVLTPSQAANMGNDGASAPVNVTIMLPGGDALGDAVVRHLAKYAQVSGGGSVQLAITGRPA